jgi:hypothetical protein
MHKLIYLLWGPRGLDRTLVSEALLYLAPRLLEAGAVQLGLDVIDPGSEMRSPTLTLPWEPQLCGLVNAWVEELAAHDRLAACLQGALVRWRVAGYRVEETVYTDYGDNRHAAPRDWPDGQRSPGIIQVTLLRRPRRLPPEEWLRRWHGTMSPVSEAIQPRTRYVRNLVLEALTPGAQRCDGVVEEAWPSARHVSNPFLYFGADSAWQLVVNLGRILRAVTSFLDLWQIRSAMMGEYLMHSDARVAKVQRDRYDG